MKFFGKIKSISGNQINVKLDDEMDVFKLDKLSNGKKPQIEINISDSRTISVEQRAKIYALIGDISAWSGYMVEKETPQIMKWKYLTETGKDKFSLSNCSMTQAREYLSWLLDFCFEYDVAFKTRTWDLLPNDYAMQYRCLTHRRCCICGRHADIAHLQTVGMCRNRHQIDHSGFFFMALCRIHHTEQHTIGIMEFLQRYHIKPIKLDADDRKKLRIGG